MLRVSIIALCYILSAHGDEVALSAQGASKMVRRHSQQSLDFSSSGEMQVQSTHLFKVQRESTHALAKPTCAEIQQGFHKAEQKSRETFCAILKKDRLVSHAPCCQENSDADCCADAKACQMSEVFDALDMSKCNEGAGAGASLVRMKAMQKTALTCADIDAQFKKEGHTHTITTFCADVVTFSLQSVATCCDNDPPDCCGPGADAKCSESEINTALAHPECNDDTGSSGFEALKGQKK